MPGGEYYSGYIEVLSGSSYSVKVGTGGIADSTQLQFNRHSGGFVLIAYGGDI